MVYKRALGVKPSPPDERDYHISKLVSTPAKFPQEFLISPLPEVYDQGSYGMCVAFSLVTIKEIQEWKERRKKNNFSPGFIYANRSDKDYFGEGMIPREALKQLLQDGVCSYSTFPYLGELPELREKFRSAWAACYEEAKTQKIKSFARLFSPEDVKSALMQLGPVMVVIPVYSSFYQGGDVSIPNISREEFDGYHAMAIIGWRNNRWIVRNSWGKTWGDEGNCTIPFNYPISEMWSLTDIYLPVPDKKQKYWRVQVGAYDKKEYAEVLSLKLKRAGFDSYIAVSGDLFLVHAGTFINKDNALKMCNMLKEKGFNCCILHY